MNEDTKRVWISEDRGDLEGKTVVITGGNSGIGYETARALSACNANVIIACRDNLKCSTALNQIRSESSKGRMTAMHLDLANLSSVLDFTDKFKSEYKELHLLINNAGLMWTPFSLTKDGFEMQFGVNHLGHFALTGLLLDRLLNTSGARVVTVSSLAHWLSRLTHADTPWHPEKYNRYKAYFDSKLANLLFARQLGRLAERHGNELISVAVHPGYSATNLQRNYAIARFANTFLAQSMEMGALPTLRAATDPDAASGDYFGPDKFMGFRGFPVRARSSKRSKDTILADVLWENSEQLSGVAYRF